MAELNLPRSPDENGVVLIKYYLWIVYPLTLPRVRPEIIYLEVYKNKINTGIVTSTAAALN